MRDISRHIMIVALKLLPEDRQSWGQAMRAEYEHMGAGKERVGFALGCLRTAGLCAARTRQGLQRIGQGLVAGGLTALCLAGLLMAQRFGDPVTVMVFQCICIFYLGAAALMLVSLKALRRYASVGGVAALLYWATQRGVDTTPDYLAALSLEVAGVLFVLFVASLYLSLIAPTDA